MDFFWYPLYHIYVTRVNWSLLTFGEDMGISYMIHNESVNSFYPVIISDLNLLMGTRYLLRRVESYQLLMINETISSNRSLWSPLFSELISEKNKSYSAMQRSIQDKFIYRFLVFLINILVIPKSRLSIFVSLACWRRRSRHHTSLENLRLGSTQDGWPNIVFFRKNKFNCRGLP